jgi:CRISPR type III-B/RAMP module-associated protein Cmr5
MTKPKNLEAERARFAFKRAQEGNKKQAKGDGFNYSAAVQELSSMIRMNGFRATMAYYYSKGGGHKDVFCDIESWFREIEPTRMLQSKFDPPIVDSGDKKKKPEDRRATIFMEVLLNLDDDLYRITQAEVLTLANWLIRFVKTEAINQISENDVTAP